ncbi:MAG: hypothetical protein ACLGPL_08685 [Acidobacteriota bacterium]
MGTQEPTSFERRGQTLDVVEIIDRWYEGRPDSTRVPLRYFRVRASDGKVYILRYHELFRAWALRVPSGEAEE